MSTISVPISPDLERFIDEQIARGESENKSAVVRKALRLLREEEMLTRLLKSQKEAREGKLLRGDLDELATQI